MNMHIAFGNDQAGHPLRASVLEWLTEQGHKVDDRGTHGTQAVDYPQICADIGHQVVEGDAERGIILGGSGMGETIAVNKIPGVRAGLCHCLFTARISRTNNDANVLILGAKIIAPSMAEEITAIWLSTPFEGGRHGPRLEQIAALDRGDPLD